MESTHEPFPGRVVFGPGSRHSTPAELRDLGTTRAVIVGGSHERSAISELLQVLEMPAEALIGVRPHVPAELVSETLERFDDCGADVVVTVGGGSATGLGKMIALQRGVELLAVPTTYAGSEMTPIWGTTDEGVKRTGRSRAAQPSVVIYDPELTLDLPRAVTVNSAFNALAHCIEALWLPGTSPAVAGTAVGAIRTIIASLPEVCRRPGDLEVRSRLLHGAHRAGSVLATAGTGILHRTAHVLGGMYDLDHGAMYAVLTPYLTAHMTAAHPQARGVLIEAIGPEPGHRLQELLEVLGGPRSLAEIGFPEDARQAAAEAIAQRTGVGVDEVEPLLAAMVAGSGL